MWEIIETILSGCVTHYDTNRKAANDVLALELTKLEIRDKLLLTIKAYKVLEVRPKVLSTYLDQWRSLNPSKKAELIH